MSVWQNMSAITISECVTIKAGYPCRGAIPECIDGEAKIVQAKDITDLGELKTNNLVATNLTARRDPDWLVKGDIVFTAKGAKNIACYISSDLDMTTCAPSLFLLRVKEAWKDKINPQFLAWQLNQDLVQAYFKRSAEGSFQVSIRKDVLAATEISLPNINIQNKISKYYEASLKEINLLKKLIQNRQQQSNAIAVELNRVAKSES